MRSVLPAVFFEKAVPRKTSVTEFIFRMFALLQKVKYAECCISSNKHRASYKNLEAKPECICN